MDALSDVLRVVRLSGGAFLDGQFTAPWAIVSQVGPEDCGGASSMPEHVLAYHYVVAGRMLVRLDGEAPIEVRSGEVVMLARNDRHVLASDPAVAPVPADPLVQAAPEGGLARISHGGGGEFTHIVCGFVGCEMRSHPLVDALPPLLRLDVRNRPAGDWFDSLFRYAPHETGSVRPGTAAMLSRLSELLFVETVRHYVESLPGDRAGWLAGLRDPAIGRSLTLMHAHVAHAWTSEQLAQAVHMSRSAFAERFLALVGLPPLSYLTRWRMQVAMQRLREGRRIAQVAEEVGYESEAAFSRAFRREVGQAPGHWRRSNDRR